MTYKVLLVDDEPLETGAMWRILDERYGSRCQLHTAVNGKTAIELAEALRVDIVLMDIEMPGINGLEAAKVIRQMLPRCRIIIVSAYERFQYAQLALSLGAEDYLLKPVDNTALFALLERTMEDIEQDRRDEARRTALDQLAKEQFVLSVISGYSSLASLESQLQELGLAFSYGFFAIIGGAARESAELIHAGVQPLLDSMPEIVPLVYEYDDTLVVAVLMRSGYLGEEEIHRIVLEKILAHQAQTGMLFWAGLGRTVTSLGELKRSYDQAAEMFSLCTTAQPVQMRLEGTAQARPYKNLERKLYAHLLEKDIEGAIHSMDVVFDTLYFALQSSEAVARTIHSLLTRVARRLQSDARITLDLSGPLAPLEETLSPQEAAIRVRALLAEWIAALDTQPSDHMHRIRTEIERYLQDNYAKDLSIKQVAKAMHYSEPYFSKLFSRCFHKNFVTYLTDIRMQAAREMLSKPRMSVREVSVAVGFADANYFAKVFRKAYGVSPTEYRRFTFSQEKPAAGEDVSAP